MNGKRFSENKARKNGFYLALAVCLVAVGIAAWSTYDAVHSYTAASASSQSAAEKEEKAVESALRRQQNAEVRGGQKTADEEDPEAPRPTVAPSKSPDRQTAGTPVKQTPSKAPESKAEAASSQPEESEAQVPVNAPLYERSSQMIYPLESQEVAKAYSAGAPVYSETMKDWRVHSGLDLTAADNEEVHACANGQVKETYADHMLGNVIVVEHGDFLFYYCGVGENFQVSEGDIVTKGQAIGTVAAVPGEAAEAAHLHLEVKRDGAYLDPQTVLNGQWQ